MSMISSVTLMGLAGDPVPGFPGFRYIDLESRDAFNEDSCFSKIPVCYWDRGISSYLLNVPNGHYVIIFGRIESEEGLGLCVVVEQLRHFDSNLLKHRSGKPQEEKK